MQTKKVRPGIKEEIRQEKPFRSPGHEASLALLRTANVIRRRLNAVIEPLGVSYEQYNVLRILRGAGSAGLPTLEVAERMVEPAATAITRLMDKLEAKKLVSRQRCKEDRRRVLCWITPAGQRLLAELDPQVDAVDSATVTTLKENETRQLLGILNRIRAT